MFSILVVCCFPGDSCLNNFSVILSWKHLRKQTSQTFEENKKKLSFGHKLKFSNWYIFVNWRCKPLIFQTKTIWSYRIHSLKYQRSFTLGCKDIGIEKLEFVAKTPLSYTFDFISFERRYSVQDSSKNTFSWSQGERRAWGGVEKSIYLSQG